MLRRALIPSLLLVLALPVAAHSAPKAQASKTCNLSRSEQRGGLGATYQFNPSVRGVSCGKAKDVIRADFEEAGDEDVIRKVLGDLTAAGVDCDEDKIAEALRNKEIEARRQIIEASNS